MKKILSTLAAFLLTSYSATSVFACSPQQQESNFEDYEIEELQKTYRQTVEWGIQDYFSSINSEFLFSTFNAEINRYKFFNKKVLDEIVKTPGAGKFYTIDDSYFPDIRNDLFNKKINLQELQLKVASAINKSIDAAKLSQFNPEGQIIKSLELIKNEGTPLAGSTISSSNENEKNYWVDLTIRIHFQFKNENMITVSSSMDKIININILSQIDMVGVINNSLANLTKKLYENFSQFDSSNMDRKMDLSESAINDYLKDESLEKIIEELIEISSTVSVEIPQDFKVQNFLVQNSLYKFPIGMEPSLNITSAFGQNGLLRKNGVVENQGSKVAKPEDFEEEIINELLEISTNLNSNVEFRNGILNYFEENEIEFDEYQFKNTISYGAFTIENIRITVDDIVLKINPIKIIFTFNLETNLNEYIEEYVSSFQWIMKQYGIENSNEINGFWKVDEREEDFWNSVKDIINANTSLNSSLFLKELTSKSGYLEYENLVSNKNFSFSLFQLDILNGWNKISLVDNNLLANGRNNLNYNIQFIVTLGTLTYKIIVSKEYNVDWHSGNTFKLITI